MSHLRRDLALLDRAAASLPRVRPIGPSGAATTVAHRIETLAIACIDGRFRDTTDHLLDRDARDIDTVFVPGASIGLTRAIEESAGLWDALRIAHDLHGVRHVRIYEHEDCGKFAELGADNSAAGHYRVATDAKRKIRQRYPDVTVSYTFLLLRSTGAVGAVP